MIRTNNRIFRFSATLFALAVANISVPMGFANVIGPSLMALQKPQKTTPMPKPSRLLSNHEMAQRHGRLAVNPYVAGSRKWGVNYKGIDLTTGNYSQTATDLSFDTGYGIPVNVTRSYSSNNADEGPLGIGWTLSVDVRTTAGGILKSSHAPVMSVPVSYKERPSAQVNDPNAPVGIQPTAAVVATDSAGTEETIQKDVDGMLSTPPWDKNTTEPTYVPVVMGTNTYQILSATKTKTLDGTVYSYTVHGSYTNGIQPMGATAAAEPSNVLKVDTVTDRQGNVTTYNYSATQAIFQKYNGPTQENELTGISMPGGHQISFVWTGNHITQAYDNGNRTVTYNYNGNLLWKATSPGLKTTTYGYDTALADTRFQNLAQQGYVTIASNLLSSITDPRGLTTQIKYAMALQGLNPSVCGYIPGPLVYWVKEPNGITTAMAGVSTTGQTDLSLGDLWTPQTLITVTSGGFGGTLLYSGNIFVGLTTNTSPPLVTVQSQDMMGATVNGQMRYQWIKTYNYWSQDLTNEINYTYPWNQGDLSNARQMRQTNMSCQSVQTATQYNFMSNPLKKDVTETTLDLNGNTTRQTFNTTEFGYWDGTKYYQQKVVKDAAGRMSLTDYYPFTPVGSPNPTPQGSIGQKSNIYSSAYSTFNYPTSSLPTGISPGDLSAWKYEITPADPSKYVGSFQYDTQGRVTNIWKLQKTTTTPWTYVQTRTTYGLDGTPQWGQAASVVEDYGHLNRTTSNNAYTSWGKPSSVTDAAGHTFVTDFYDNDGLVQDIRRTDGGLNQTLVSYAYGQNQNTIDYGQPNSVVDGLSGITQQITYQANGNGIGQVSQIAQSGGASSAYITSYSYDAAGNRSTASYSTQDGTINWLYGNYVAVGPFNNAKMVFQTLTKLNGSSLTAEAMHYQFDSGGRLTGAAFAQTPYTGYTPTGTNPWYDANHPAQTRARAYYAYDAGGRTWNCDHYWDTLNSGTNTYGSSTLILANDCTYDSVLGLKQSSTYSAATGNPRTEYYGYDSNLDYLTGATYNDGLANGSPTWTYDAAGNRTDSVCDNLNRTTSISGTSTTCDILGNRTALGSITTYGWDCLNRMTSFTNSTGTMNYQYRADGMRTRKSTSSGFTEYYHDAQMPMEDAFVNGTSLTATRYGLGARGIDYEEVATGTYTNGTTRTVGSYSNVGFPIYDSHGSMIATLARSGAGYQVNNQRSYDAWGAIRQGAATADPKNRYCASLGHQQDDESGLIYMRARFYEPGSGRFVSEDSARQGRNWYCYCNNEPVSKWDRTGKGVSAVFMAMLSAYYAAAAYFWEPGSIEAKAAKEILDATLGALAMVDTLDSMAQFVAANPETAASGAAIGIIVCTGALAAVLVGIAAYQMSLLIFMATNGDFPAGQANLGNFRSLGALGSLLGD